MSEPVVKGRSGRPKRLGRVVPTDPVVLDEGFQRAGGVDGLGSGLSHGAPLIVHEPEPSVNLESTPFSRLNGARLPLVADPKDDDRGEAINWYVRLLIQQGVDRGDTRKALMVRGGIDKGHLSQVENGKLGMKFGVYFRFCRALERDPAELLAEALAWWPSAGRKYKARALEEMAKKARKASESGEHPAVTPPKRKKTG